MENAVWHSFWFIVLHIWFILTHRRMGFSLKWAKRSALFSRNGNAFVAATKTAMMAMTATKTTMTTTTAAAAKKRFNSDCPTLRFSKIQISINKIVLSICRMFFLGDFSGFVVQMHCKPHPYPLHIINVTKPSLFKSVFVRKNSITLHGWLPLLPWLNSKNYWPAE